MSESLQEFVDSRSQSLRVDRAAGVIRGVKLLGLSSRNGRRYRENALVEATKLYEGAKVNVNHPKGHPLSPRDYQDRLGEIRGVQYRAGEGLFGDLHFNPKHALSEQLMWDAEHAPHNVGLSHNVLARTTRDGDATAVEAITKVQSIDLVADPATTAGLFEAISGEVEESSSGVEQQSAGQLTTPPHHCSATALDRLTLEELERHRPDLVRQLREEQQSQLEQLRRQADELTADLTAIKRRQRILELIQEHGLPLPSAAEHQAALVSPQFIDALMRADSDDAVERLVQERAELIRSALRSTPRGRTDRRPRSRDQLPISFDTSGQRPRSGEEFAAAIRGGGVT